MMNKDELNNVLKQIHFFNQQFHASENQPHLKDFHELMRASKNRCQLMLLKFTSPESKLVWVRLDPKSTDREWLIGLFGLPDNDAAHIPLHTLQKGLSAELLTVWKIH